MDVTINKLLWPIFMVCMFAHISYAKFICLFENLEARTTQSMCGLSENFSGMFTLKSRSAPGGSGPYSFSKSRVIFPDVFF